MQALKTAKLSKDVEAVVQLIAQENVLTGPAVGYAGEEPQQYLNYMALKEIATNSDLEILLEHSNPVVRVYAVEALLEREESGQAEVDLWEIGWWHLTDFEQFTTFFGCIITDGEIVADYFIKVAIQELDREVRNESEKEKKRKELNLKVLSLPQPLSYRYELIRSMDGTDDDYYLPIKKLAEKGDEAALLALAKFDVASDLALSETLEEKNIIRFFELVELKKRQVYKPKLSKYAEKMVQSTEHYSNEWKFFYRALAAYEDEFAVRLLDFVNTTTKGNPMRKYHLNFMYDALKDYRTGLYDKLFFVLWEDMDGKNTSVEMIDYLRKKYPTKTEALILRETVNTDDYFSIEDVVEHMVRIDLQLNREEAISKMADNIRTTNVHVFKAYANIAMKEHHPKLKQAFQDRLKTEDNMHITGPAQEVLDTYSEERIQKW